MPKSVSKTCNTQSFLHSFVKVVFIVNTFNATALYSLLILSPHTTHIADKFQFVCVFCPINPNHEPHYVWYFLLQLTFQKLYACSKGILKLLNKAAQSSGCVLSCVTHRLWRLQPHNCYACPKHKIFFGQPVWFEKMCYRQFLIYHIIFL